MPYRLSADIGGTFTDIIRLDVESGMCDTTKVPTTSDNLATGIIAGFDEICAGDYSDVEDIVHGTTNGLNALIERAGAKTAAIVTKGFRDSYEIGRGNHPEMYNVRYHKVAPLVARADVHEIRERLRSDGTVEHKVDADEVRRVVEGIAQQGYEALAICLINSFVDSSHEREVAQIASTVFSGTVTTSSDVSPESREFERFSTAILNAYVAPTMERYLVDLERSLQARGFRGRLSVMNSNGGRMSAALARQYPVRTLMSGPIGGVIGTAHVGALIGNTDLVAIDMGGTSFDVSVLDGGELDIVMETDVEGIPVLTPTVNTVSVGAGGGSIAWTEVGAMRVGPQSAGAVPGPISYGHGGTRPTVTDANLVLGRIDPAGFLGGRMRLDEAGPRASFDAFGAEHGLTGIEAADGVLQIAGNTMADAIRQITLWRGRDVRDMALLAYGGAGPMHAALIADQLEVTRVIVPEQPGAFSAWGMLYADVTLDRTRSILVELDRLEPAHFEDVASTHEAELAGELAQEGLADPRFFHSLDLRYVGQSYALNRPVTGAFDSGLVRADFDATYERLYGFSTPSAAVEVLSVRTAAKVTETRVPRPTPPAASDEPPRSAVMYIDGEARAATVHDRAALTGGGRIAGPAIVTELTATTVVPAGWDARVDSTGALILERIAAKKGRR